DGPGGDYLHWSHPRKFGQCSYSCHICSNLRGLIRKYTLDICHQCFHHYMKDIGFIELD
uniref:Small ribosomal subunit protein uS14 n=1 Tax=Equus asinus asinus TaxID=83772 RepID=A0A8C4MZI3_EQUAS